MKRVGTMVLAAALVMGMAQVSKACDKAKAGGCSKSAKATTAAVTASSDKVVDQGFAQVMDALPKMTYRVGELETCCAKTAREAAAKADTPIQYVVAGETYSCRKTAMNKLAEQIEAELPKLAKVVHVVDGEALGCPKSAAKLAAERNSAVKHMVAGVEFDCPHHAQQVADQLATKLASSHGCAKAFAEGCDKGAKAETASAEGGCHKSKAAQAKAAQAKTASSAGIKPGGCCAKKKAAEAAAAKTAAAETSKTTEAEAETATADAQATDTEETPQLANAKLLVREIVEFVAASRNS